MAKRYGKCSNIGNCDIADQKKEVEVLDGQEFNCPDCGNSLYPVISGRGSEGNPNTLKKWLLIGMPLLLLLIGGLWWYNNINNSETVNNSIYNDTDTEHKPDIESGNFVSQFNFTPTPPEPGNSVLRGVVELGATGFNYFVIRVDDKKNWELVQSKFGWSLVFEHMATEEDIALNLKNYIGEILNLGVRPSNVHFIVSSGAHQNDEVQKIERVLIKNMGFVVNTVTTEQEAKYALISVMPKGYESKSFVVDIGSANTKIAWLNGNNVIGNGGYGAKYLEKNINSEEVYKDTKLKASEIPKNLRRTCFIIGGVPFELAKQKRQAKERFTTLESPASYKPNGDKQLGGINIYKAIADETGCEEFIFDWDANFSIGFLLSL